MSYNKRKTIEVKPKEFVEHSKTESTKLLLIKWTCKSLSHIKGVQIMMN